MNFMFFATALHLPQHSFPTFTIKFPSLRLVPRTRSFQNLSPSSNLAPFSYRPFPPPSRLHASCLASRHYPPRHYRLHLLSPSHARHFPVIYPKSLSQPLHFSPLTEKLCSVYKHRVTPPVMTPLYLPLFYSLCLQHTCYPHPFSIFTLFLPPLYLSPSVISTCGPQSRLDTCSGHHSPEQALDTRK